MSEYECKICGKIYNVKFWYQNHLYKVHQVHNENDIDWDKDQLELAMELSMKDTFKDFIPEEEDIANMSSIKKCSVCLSNKAEIAFIPCGHLVTCEICGKKIKNSIKARRKCPICRHEVESILKIFI